MLKTTSESATVTGFVPIPGCSHCTTSLRTSRCPADSTPTRQASVPATGQAVPRTRAGRNRRQAGNDKTEKTMSVRRGCLSATISLWLDAPARSPRQTPFLRLWRLEQGRRNRPGSVRAYCLIMYTPASPDAVYTNPFPPMQTRRVKPSRPGNRFSADKSNVSALSSILIVVKSVESAT
jgi:hypothetical protein